MTTTMQHHWRQVLVLLVLLVGTLPSMRAETQTWNCYQTTVTLTDDGKLTVSKSKGDGQLTDFTEHMPSPWYEDEFRTRVKTIVIENGVTHIGDYAFWNLEEVTSVTIAESVTSIGSRAFCSCFKLRELTIPASVTRIGADAFYLCQNLLNVYYYANPANITEWTDNGCNDFVQIGTKSTAVHVFNRFLTGYQQKFSGVNVTFIGDLDGNNGPWQSGNCTVTLADDGTITITKNNGSDGRMDNAQYGDVAWSSKASAVKKVIVSNGVTYIGSKSFSECTNLKEVILPNTLTSISGLAFYKCSSLTTISIPASVTYIGQDAFLECTAMTDVYCYADPTALSWNDSDNNDFKPGRATKCHVKGGMLTVYNQKYGPNSSRKVNVTFVGDLPDDDPTANLAINAENFPDASFREFLHNCNMNNGDYNLSPSEMTLFKQLDVHGQNIANLKGIEYFTNLETLDCSDNNLSTLDLSSNYKLKNLNCSSNRIKGDGMQALIGNLSHNRGKLIIINLDDPNEQNAISTTLILAAQNKLWTVYAIENGQEVIYQGSDMKETWESGDCTLTLLTDGMMVVKKKADNLWGYMDNFNNSGMTPWDSYTSAIKTISISKGVISIGSWSFANCTNLTSISLPDSFSIIEQGAFWGCNNLQRLDLPYTIQNIEKDAFYDCKALTDIYCYGIPDEINWTDNNHNDFMSAKATKCHVKKSYLAKFQQKFSDVNVTFVGDLEDDFNLEVSNNRQKIDDKKSYYWSTFYHPTANYVINSSNAMVYTAQLSDDATSVILKEIGGSGTIIPAGTPVIIRTEFVNYSLIATNSEVTSFGFNQLQGGTGSAVPGAYCLANGANGIGFYPYSGAIGSNSAYFTVPASASGFIGFDDSTAPVIDYPVWVGETHVNSRNKADVLGDGTVNYTPGNGTGTLTFAEPTTISGQHASAKIFARDIDLTINAPKGLTLESTSEGIYINSNGKTLTINGNVNINTTKVGINAYNVVLNGTNNSITSGEEPCIAAEGSLTINGKVTATISNPTAGPISYPAILTMSGITISEGYEITEPKNGQIKQFEVNGVSFTSIAGADGNYTSHVVIAPHVHQITTAPGVAPTCTESGYTASTRCDLCGLILTEHEEIPALGHDWGEWIVTREETPEKPGEETRTCHRDASHQETRPLFVKLAINNINFPDDNFRQFVLDWYDTDKDQQLSKEEIAAVDMIEVGSEEKVIADLTGIEYFTELERLYCDDNSLKKIDVTKNTKLEILHCPNNQLTTLDVTKNTNLVYLYCSNNQLTTLDLSNNPELKQLFCYGNQIKGKGMDALIESLPKVTNSEFYAIATSISTEQNVLTKHQVAIAKTKGWTVYNKTGEISKYEEYEGTEPAITYPVWVGDTQVDEQNTNDVLGDGTVSYTPGNGTGTLTFAEPTTISGQHASAKIYARDIDLTINAPKGLTLENTNEGVYINCNGKTLTINGNVNINSARAGIVAYNVVLNGTDNSITTGGEPCIAAEGSLTINGKLTATISNPIAGPISYPAILTMSTITIPEGYEITEPKNGQIMQFKVNDVSFTSIAGTDGNYAPHVVIAPHHVHSMKETTGKGATCTEPGFETYWTCTSCNKMFSDEQGENEISAPREIPATGHIWGEWVVTREATTTQEGEETRTCLNDPSHKETRNFQVAIANVLAIDATNFPDEKFRNYLLEQVYGQDGYLTDSEIDNCTEMDAIFLDAISLKGIEHFTALKVLKCYGNDLTELDITKNTALETLICHNNQLTTLDLSKNTALKELDCVRNQLTTLDLSNNTALLELDFMGNLLTTIDLSKNTALEQLYCSENQLTALDVSKNTALKVIECSENKLTEIDITKNVALVVLDCRDNQIHTINVSPDCTALMAIDSRHNQLKGENVDALIENLPMKTANAQGMIGFCVEDNEEGNIMTPEQVAAATQKYWQILYWQEGAKDDDFMLYPGSTTQIQSLERTSTEPGATENWYDLHGHKLNSQPKKKGLYIKNGKKVVVN